MIGTIRKHSKWMWGIIIFIVIVTFVFWGAQDPNRGNRAEFDLGRIQGRRIEVEEYRSARREVYLWFLAHFGEWPGDDARRRGFDVERQTYVRLMMLQKLKDEKVRVSEETVAKAAADLVRMFNRGQPAPLKVFEENVLRQQGFTAVDLERYLHHELALQQLIVANAMSGRLVTPAEARMVYERENQEVVTEAVFFAGTNYLAGITVTPEAVSQFFTNRMANYRLPERVQVSYVAVEYSNLLAQAEAELVKTNFNEIIEDRLQKVGTNYFVEAKTPEEKRAKMREDLIKGYATTLARKQANEFANATEVLPEKEKTLAAFEKLATERKLTVQTTTPFDREEGPKEIVVGADFLKESFLRTPEEPFYGPLPGRDAAYVIALKARLPSEIPPFESLRQRVTEDYRFVQSVLAARAAGERFVQALTNGLASGKKFSSLCAEASLKPVTVPALSLTTRTAPVVEEHVNLNQYKNAAFTTPIGQASGLVLTGNGGFVVFVREKLPMELARLNQELPEFTARLRQVRQDEAYSYWINREAERNLRDVVAFQQPQQQLQPAGRPAPAKK